MKLAVTGGIASGKSLVCRCFQKHGAYIASADQIVHQLLSSNPQIIKKIISEFGQGIETEGSIDRKKLADVVFSDRAKLELLESILHPAVFIEIDRLEQIARDQGYSLFVAEVPLLFEIGAEKRFDKSIAVVAPLQMRRDRYQKIAGKSLQDFDRRSSRLLPQEEIAKRATFVIQNDKSRENLEIEVKKILEQSRT